MTTGTVNEASCSYEIVDTNASAESEPQNGINTEIYGDCLWRRIAYVLAFNKTKVSQADADRIKYDQGIFILETQGRIRSKKEELAAIEHNIIVEQLITKHIDTLPQSSAICKHLMQEQQDTLSAIDKEQQKLAFIWRTAENIYALDQTMVTAAGLIEVRRTYASHLRRFSNISHRYFMKKWYVLGGKTYATTRIVNVKNPDVSLEAFSELANDFSASEYFCDSIEFAKRSFLHCNEDLEVMHKCDPSIAELKDIKPRDMSNLVNYSMSEAPYKAKQILNFKFMIYRFEKEFLIDGITCFLADHYYVDTDIADGIHYIRVVTNGNIQHHIYSLTSARKHFMEWYSSEAALASLDQDHAYKSRTIQVLVERAFDAL